MALVIRSVKGTELTSDEVDENFIYLDNKITSLHEVPLDYKEFKLVLSETIEVSYISKSILSSLQLAPTNVSLFGNKQCIGRIVLSGVISVGKINPVLHKFSESIVISSVFNTPNLVDEFVFSSSSGNTSVQPVASDYIMSLDLGSDLGYFDYSTSRGADGIYLVYDNNGGVTFSNAVTASFTVSIHGYDKSSEGKYIFEYMAPDIYTQNK